MIAVEVAAVAKTGCRVELFLFVFGLDAVDGASADAERSVGQLLDGDHEKLLRDGGGLGGGKGDLFDQGLFR